MKGDGEVGREEEEGKPREWERERKSENDEKWIELDVLVYVIFERWRQRNLKEKSE